MNKKIVTFLFILFLSGCASIPRQEALSLYNINGVNYFSLVSLCRQRGIDWDYDIFTRTATLTKGSHTIKLMIGETLVFVDGLAQHLRHRVDFYQGMLVVPYRFKTQILNKVAPLVLSNIKTIVIDAGHGGHDPGAIGRHGLKEKYVNLDIASRLARLLKDDGINVLMTRSSDKFISLQKRAEIANEAKADFFVSIHANANRTRGMNGFEVYYISSDIDDSARALASAKQASLDLDKGSFSNPSLDLKATLWDMIYTENRAESVELAQAICRAIRQDLNTRVRGVKAARFYVLKGTHMPAVLIEVGYLSNGSEEHLLSKASYRQGIAETISQGIRNYAQEYRVAQLRQ